MAKGASKPVYVLSGKDDFLRRQHRRAIIEEVAGGGKPSGDGTARGAGDLAVSEFEGSAELSAVLDEARTLPLLAARRVVIVADADRFVRAHAKPLLAYMESPATAGVLMLIVNDWPPKHGGKGSAEAEGEQPASLYAQQDEPPKKELDALLKKLVEAVAKVGRLIDCTSPEQRDLPARVVKLAAERGKRIRPDAVAELVACIGNNLSGLDSEIEKLSLYVGERAEIVKDDVEAVAYVSAGPKIFALSDAVAAGKTKEALEALDALLLKRGDEFPLLGLIASRLRMRLAGREWGSPRRLPARRTGQDFRKVLRADLAMKSGADAKAVMQWLVAALCQ